MPTPPPRAGVGWFRVGQRAFYAPRMKRRLLRDAEYRARSGAWTPGVAGEVIDPPDDEARRLEGIGALGERIEDPSAASPGAGGAFNVRGFGATGDGVSDDTAELQAALSAAVGGGTVFVPAGTYLISSALRIGSNTRLTLDPAATIRRNAAIDNMLRNAADGTTGGYGASSNIIVEGGRWDANRAAFASNTCALAFGHAKRIVIRDTTITGVHGWHHLELNAVQDTKVVNCQLLDFDPGTTTQEELIQLDAALASAQFPWFGPYDNTGCDNIEIRGNVLRGGPRGIGSHSAKPAGPTHTNILILGNTIEDANEYGVLAFDWAHVTIADNLIHSCDYGGIFVATAPGSGTGMRNVSISGNKITGTTEAGSWCRAIHVGLNATATTYVTGVRIIGNYCYDGWYGITADFSRNVVISGNHVEDMLQSGIYAWKGQNWTISGNMAAGNATAGGNAADLYIGASAGAVIGDMKNVAVTGNVAGTGRVEFADDVVIVGNRFNTSYTDSARGGVVTAASNGTA